MSALRLPVEAEVFVEHDCEYSNLGPHEHYPNGSVYFTVPLPPDAAQDHALDVASAEAVRTYVPPDRYAELRPRV